MGETKASATVVERSSTDIRRDIAARRENLSRTVGQLGDRFEEKLDWRGYVKRSPFWALSAAVGLGYLAVRLLRPATRATPSSGTSAHVQAGPANPGLLQATLMGIAAQTAANWLRHATSPAAAPAAPADKHKQG